MARLNKKDIDASVHRSRSQERCVDAQPFALTDIGNLYFDEAGNQYNQKIDAEKVTAQVVKTANGIEYFIKTNRKYELYIPNNKFYTRTSLTIGKQMGMDPFKLIKTNADALKYYVQFLQTKNPSYLRMAERNF